MKIYRLKESKTTQLKKLLKNGNITEEQFQIADEFFKKYSAFENEIDWNRGLNITWEDLKAVIYKERSSESKTRKKIRKGLEGFEEGKDYLVLEETNSYTAYQPFTWEASRMIASHYVEPSKNKYGDLDDADWCTAYQKDRGYWDGHNKTEAFIYICGETIPTKKVAVSISKEEYDANNTRLLYSTSSLNFNIWDFNDHRDTIEEDELLEVVLDLHNLIKKAYGIWKDKKREELLSKFKLNPQTNRYDYDKTLRSEELRNLVAEDGDGFTINFGKVENFNCSGLGLTSLKGAPIEVHLNFICAYNNLTSLEGAPKKVGGSFFCSWNNLTSLEGAPKKVGGSFDCSRNQLTSLKGAPQRVGGDFNCSWNQLTSLERAPKEVGGSFNCSGNHLTSLEGASQTVVRDFNCSWNKLTSLEGTPQKVDGRFDCSTNQLISLEGAPTEVGGGFDCSDNYLTSLEGAPQKVGEWFNCHNNPNLHSLEGIGKVKEIIIKDF